MNRSPWSVARDQTMSTLLIKPRVLDCGCAGAAVASSGWGIAPSAGE
jgi:hypothetical protein